MGWRESGFNCWGVWGPALMLFLFYVNISGMRPLSRFPSQPLTIPSPWVLFRIKWSILLVPPWVTVSCFLAGNKEAELKPQLSLHSYFSVISCFYSSPDPAMVTRNYIYNISCVYLNSFIQECSHYHFQRPQSNEKVTF